jgi:transposase-like protein
MGRGRTFSREFKLSVVREVATGAKRPVQICREHALSDGVLHRWRQEYAQRGEEAFLPRDDRDTPSLEQRIADLERLCGQLALENAALKKGLHARASRSDTP